MTVVQVSPGHFKRVGSRARPMRVMPRRGLITPDGHIVRDAVINNPPLMMDGTLAEELHLQTETIKPRAELYENCRAARMSGFPILQGAGVKRSDPIVIVGASPGLEEYLDDIGRWNAAGVHVMAVKGAHDYLLSKGIVPDSAVAADPQIERSRIFTPFRFKSNRAGITYYMASQMHPSTWKYMRGQNVIIWHPWIDEAQFIMPEWKGVKKVYGGCTTGLRSICIAWILGWRDVHLYGFESKISDTGKMRVTGEGCYDYDQPFPVCWGGRWFMTNVSLAQQVNDLMATLQQCPGVKVKAYGDGPLPHVLKLGKALGWPV